MHTAAVFEIDDFDWTALYRADADVAFLEAAVRWSFLAHAAEFVVNGAELGFGTGQ